MIFTNNNSFDNWVDTITEYIHRKIKYPLFDQIIKAYKVNGKQIEICRSSYSKTYDDFLNCTKLSKDTKIFFIDDKEHPQMENQNVKYFNIEPYTYNLNFNKLATNFYDNNIELFKSYNKTKDEFVKYINDNTDNNHRNFDIKKNKNQINKDYFASKKLNNDIMLFFNKTTTITTGTRNRNRTRTRTRTRTTPRTTPRTRTRTRTRTTPRTIPRTRTRSRTRNTSNSKIKNKTL